MELTNDEKNVLKLLINQLLAELEDENSLRDATPSFLAADIRYDEFLKNLLKKIG